MTKHADERGAIEDLLVTDEGGVTLVTFNKGAVRGNHLHRLTVQTDFVLRGNLICRTPYGERFMTAGESITHHVGVAHAYLAVTDAVMVSCAYGPRKGEDYETDTYRLDVPLL